MERYKLNIHNILTKNITLLDYTANTKGVLISRDDKIILQTKEKIDGDLKLGKYYSGTTTPIIETISGVSIGNNEYELDFRQQYYNVESFDTDTKQVKFKSNLGIYPQEKGMCINFSDDTSSITSYDYWFVDKYVGYEVDPINYNIDSIALNKLVLKDLTTSEWEYLKTRSTAMICNLYNTTTDKKTNKFLTVTENNIVKLRNFVKLFISKNHFKVPLHIQSSEGTNMTQEGNIMDGFVNDIKSKVIPETLDMEKIAFRPAYTYNGDIIDISEINFNFHFRERLKESDGTYKSGWYTNNDCDWNGISENSTVDTQTINKSDLLGYLNFNDDDVYYQQAKLKKSFIRLSFYDSDQALSQQLLGYSTVFVDTSDLFGKMANNRTKDPSFGVLTDNTPNDDNTNRLDTRIVIYDNHNTTKSSEGFYIYLFKDEVSQNNPIKDIYMKIEYNHAGYGRTLPFIKPYPGGSTILTIPYDDYFSYSYIKLRLKYIDSAKKYVYTLEDDSNIGCYVDKNNNRMVFNLFEPKLSND